MSCEVLQFQSKHFSFRSSWMSGPTNSINRLHIAFLQDYKKTTRGQEIHSSDISEDSLWHTTLVYSSLNYERTCTSGTSSTWFLGSVPLTCLLITLLQYLLLTCALFLAEPTGSSSLSSDSLSVSPPVPPAALGIVLTSGCATSRHCQQQELPGVRIHCCDSDLCNGAPYRQCNTMHYVCAVASLLLLRMLLWYKGT